MVDRGKVVEPGTERGIADALAQATHEGLRVRVRGGGTKLHWAGRAAAPDVVVSTRGVARMVEHAHGDLTATIEAGARLTDVNRALAARGQWLPFDTAFDEATIGGILATNDSGPLRHRYGTPRDLIIGVTLATVDGQIVRAGGRVVKNVAGYDLGKLVTGSMGRLAAIVSATFKLAPRPFASRTVVASFKDQAAASDAIAAVAASQLEPQSFDLHADGAAVRVLVRFASTERAIAAECRRASDLLQTAGASARVEVSAESGEAEDACWREQVCGIWSRAGAVLRMSWRPAAVRDVLAAVNLGADGQSAAAELAGRAGVGAGLLRLEGDPIARAEVLERLMGLPAAGHFALLRGDEALADRVARASASSLAHQAIARAFDARSTLT